jgi:hypothetical protein
MDCGPLIISQNASIPIALNLVNRLDGTPILNPGAPARASLLVNFPDGTTKLWTNLPRWTVATPNVVTVGEHVGITLNTVGGTDSVDYTYTTSAAETAAQIAMGIAVLINAALPTNWTCVADGADLVFASPEPGDSVSFTNSANVTVSELGLYPTVTWTNAQILFTPPTACFAIPGIGTWNIFLDNLEGAPHVPSFTGDFRVIAPGEHAY